MLPDTGLTGMHVPQIGLATRLERHDLMEFRRIAAHIYKSNLRWRKAVALAKQDKLYKVQACSSSEDNVNEDNVFMKDVMFRMQGLHITE